MEAGLRYGLEAHGVEVIPYRLDTRLTRAKSWLTNSWRAKKDATVARPTTGEALLQAGIGAVEQALRHQVDAVVIVSGILLHPDVVVLLRRAGLRCYVLFTESPYDHEHELRVAAMSDGGWTHERAVLGEFQKVNPLIEYLPHAWHPGRHGVKPRVPDAPAHDVVMVGAGFPERITFLNGIDWAGIDLGLYGIWKGFGLKEQVAKCVQSGPIENETAQALYRNAKVGLNLYRRTRAKAESLNPRAYELAACGLFYISEYREESAERFGGLVPTFTTPKEAEAMIRLALSADEERAAVSVALPDVVAEDSWTDRAVQVLEDMSRGRRRDVPSIMTSPSDARLFDHKDAGRAPAFPGQHWYQAEGRA